MDNIKIDWDKSFSYIQNSSVYIYIFILLKFWWLELENKQNLIHLILFYHSKKRPSEYIFFNIKWLVATIN